MSEEEELEFMDEDDEKVCHNDIVVLDQAQKIKKMNVQIDDSPQADMDRTHNLITPSLQADQPNSASKVVFLSNAKN